MARKNGKTLRGTMFVEVGPEVLRKARALRLLDGKTVAEQITERDRAWMQDYFSRLDEEEEAAID